MLKYDFDLIFVLYPMKDGDFEPRAERQRRAKSTCEKYTPKIGPVIIFQQPAHLSHLIQSFILWVQAYLSRSCI